MDGSWIAISGREFFFFFGSLGDLCVVCTTLESEDGAMHGCCMVVLST
jgi:hypothetical protein